MYICIYLYYMYAYILYVRMYICIYVLKCIVLKMKETRGSLTPECFLVTLKNQVNKYLMVIYKNVYIDKPDHILPDFNGAAHSTVLK